MVLFDKYHYSFENSHDIFFKIIYNKPAQTIIHISPSERTTLDIANKHVLYCFF